MTGVEVGLLEDTTFVVGDGATMQLRRFSNSGNLLGTGAGQGDGPGELLSIGTLFATADGLAVVDISRGMLAVYGNSLHFRSQVNLRELPGGERSGVFARDRDGGLYALGGPQARRPPSPTSAILRQPLVVERFTLSSGRVDTLFTVPGPEFYFVGGGTRTRRFGMQPFVFRTPGGFVSGNAEQWEFVDRDASGTVRRIIRLDWPRRAVTEQMRTAQLRLDHQRIDDLPVGRFQDIRRMATIDFADPHFPDSLPPFDASRLGRDGTLWLREGMAPSDSQQRWFVFRDDTLLSTLELPRGLDLLDAQRGRLLLRRTDSLDIGYVELRSIRTAP